MAPRCKACTLGKVVGNVVCSVQNESLNGRTLLLVRRLPQGPVVVAVDAVGAGVGETVYVCRGKEASFPFLPNEVPTEATIVAIVDPPSPMIIARVIDNVVATQKHKSHADRKFFSFSLSISKGSDDGDPVVALDAVSAGIGDRVLVVQEGFSAMTSVGRPDSPIDASVIGIIDLVELA